MHLWERERPSIKTTTGHTFGTIHALFSELGRPTREALNALIPKPGPDGEPPSNHTPAPVDPRTPRVVDWACVPLPGFDPNQPQSACALTLFVLQPDSHQVELWSTHMTSAEEPEVREQLAELAEENTALWWGTTPDPCDVASLVDRVVGGIAETSLAATGLATEQAVEAYTPVRAAALQGVMTLLAHADEKGWTGPQMAQAWREYVNDVEPTPW